MTTLCIEKLEHRENILLIPKEKYRNILNIFTACKELHIYILMRVEQKSVRIAITDWQIWQRVHVLASNLVSSSTRTATRSSE